MPNLYNTGFPVSYQPVQPYYSQPQYMQQTVPQQYMNNVVQQGVPQDQRTIHGFDWVLGSQAANAYTVPAGKTFVLFDATPNSDHFWLKSSDVTGKPFPAVMFDYAPHKEDEKADSHAQSVDLSGYVPIKEFDELKKELSTLKETKNEALTSDDVKELFDKMMEDRFSQLSAPSKTKKKEVSE